MEPNSSAGRYDIIFLHLESNILEGKVIPRPLTLHGRNAGRNKRRRKTAAKLSAIAAQADKDTQRSPCGDPEQCEALKQNGEGRLGRRWHLQTLEEHFLEGPSLVGLALTSNSGLR